MDYAVCILGELYEVFGKPLYRRRAPQSARIIDAVTKSWLGRTVVDRDRIDSHYTVVVHLALLDFLRIDFYTPGGKLLSGLTASNVKLECFGKMLRHGSCSRWPQIRNGFFRPKNHPVSHRSGMPTT